MTRSHRSPRHPFSTAAVPALLVAAFVAGCGASGNPVGLATGALGVAGGGAASDSAAASIRMTGLQFVPPSDTVGVGALVTWTNDDGVSHTVVADDGSFDSGKIPPQGSFAHTFPDTGSVPYHDKDYGAPGSGMHGTIVVR